jgi:aerobic C4-dicarboxylate transport protein
MTRRRWYSSLYAQVLIGIALGVLLGAISPESGAAMKPLGDGFIKLIKMLIAPIVFTTIAVGIARIGALTEVGRIGLRALIYFEVISSLALIIGLVVVNVLQPGAGLQPPAGATPPAVAGGDAGTGTGTAAEFILRIIPDTVVGAFARGDILQILVIAVLVGVALLMLGARAADLVELIDQLSKVFFTIVGIVMRLAPLGAFGAMAFTIGQYGLESLWSLGRLMAGVYITCIVFIVLVLGTILRLCGLKLWSFLRYIREELLIVLGTSSSESALPGIMQKLEHMGCAKTVVGLVIPTGYSFNLDGTAIYMTMAAVFVAQAGGVQLSLSEQLSILAILLLTSKGAAGVTGSGFVTLAATISVIPSIPPAGLALLVGVDRFMSEARALTNLIGNGVATVAIARWDGALDLPRARAVLAGSGADSTTAQASPLARALSD